jgi:hypothetical protein
MQVLIVLADDIHEVRLAATRPQGIPPFVKVIDILKCIHVIIVLVAKHLPLFLNHLVFLLGVLG